MATSNGHLNRALVNVALQCVIVYFASGERVDSAALDTETLDLVLVLEKSWCRIDVPKLLADSHIQPL